MNCSIYIDKSNIGNLQHLHQIVEGFTMLKKEINVEYIQNVPFGLKNKQLCIVEIGGKKILYDTLDGYSCYDDNLSEEGNLNLFDFMLDKVDFCFKRSFSIKINTNLKNAFKIHPLGFNYEVGRSAIKRFFFNSSIKSMLINSSKFYFNMFSPNFFVKQSLTEEDVKNEGKIIFMTRLWEGEANKTLNKVRIECIRACKKEFGDRFYGGLIPNKLSSAYPDLLLKNNSKRRFYLKFMFGCRYCIATTGLFHSIGWKFAEYIAASKCIISEPLYYQVPGDFTKDKNYLEFTNADELIKHIKTLDANPNLQIAMSRANNDYYNNYLSPDKLIYNSLKELSLI